MLFLGREYTVQVAKLMAGILERVQVDNDDEQVPDLEEVQIDQVVEELHDSIKIEVPRLSEDGSQRCVYQSPFREAVSAYSMNIASATAAFLEIGPDYAKEVFYGAEEYVPTTIPSQEEVDEFLLWVHDNIRDEERYVEDLPEEWRKRSLRQAYFVLIKCWLLYCKLRCRVENVDTTTLYSILRVVWFQFQESLPPENIFHSLQKRAAAKIIIHCAGHCFKDIKLDLKIKYKYIGTEMRGKKKTGEDPFNV